jgi:hypothetical protein
MKLTKCAPPPIDKNSDDNKAAASDYGGYNNLSNGKQMLKPSTAPKFGPGRKGSGLGLSEKMEVSGQAFFNATLKDNISINTGQV